MKIINISQVDTIFANGSYPIEFLLFYKNGLKSKNIRSALSKLSSSFWPIFGKYDAGAIHYDKYSEIDCYDEHTNNIEFEANDSSQKIFNKYYNTISSNMNKLFFLRIIQYKNGTVLIPKLNHLAGDGYSYFYFLSVLAAMSKDYSIPFKKQFIQTFFKPNHKRTILRKFQLGDIELNPVKEFANLSTHFEKISHKAVREKIKSIELNLNQHVSTNDISSAMVLKKSVEIQPGKFGNKIQLTIPIDVRRQIKPYGFKYFGNGLMFKAMNFNVSEIEESTISEIAVRIRSEMPSVEEDIYIEYLKKLESIVENKDSEKLKPYNPDTGCLVTNLSKMPTNKLNFGTGNPDIIIPLTVGKNSAAIMAERDNYILRLVY